MMLVGDRAPSAIESIDDRLRSRFEGGLVLELATGAKADLTLIEAEEVSTEDTIYVPALGDDSEQSGEAGRREPQPSPVAIAEPPKKGGAWFPGPENVVIHWPRLNDLLIEELD
jgi:hypothetical protein